MLTPIVLIFLKVVLTSSQRTGYNEICNNTEECSDHRYTCRLGEENLRRCLCDRFHIWDVEIGCVQIYNVTDIMNMTIKDKNNILESLQKYVRTVLNTQVFAGLFVIGMVIVAAVVVTIFCIYVHVENRKYSKKLEGMLKKNEEERERCKTLNKFNPCTSTTIV